MKRPAILGNHWWSDYMFNPETCQLAYKKDQLAPNDHGYYKGMSAFVDYENDKCIVRNFDNVLVTARLKGFYYILKDEMYDKERDYDTIPLSEVIRLMDENEPTKPKIYVNTKKTDDKKQALMEQAIRIAKDIDENDPSFVSKIFALTDVVRRNAFTPQDLHDFINKTK